MLGRLLSFIAITVSCAWLWLSGGSAAYGSLLTWLGAPLIEFLFGAEGVQLARAPDRFVNYAAFLGAVALTPRVSTSGKWIAVAWGLPCILVSHLALVVVSFGLGAPAGGQAALDPRMVFALLLNDALPVGLWFVLWSRASGADCNDSRRPRSTSSRSRLQVSSTTPKT